MPSLANPVGYLSNNVAGKSIDLVITSAVTLPRITQQPQPDSAYTNFFAHFTVALEQTNAPGYQWRRNGPPLANGGHVAGASTAYLKLSNVSFADVGNYDVVITNTSGSVTSSAAPLSLQAPFGYEAAAVALNPVALLGSMIVVIPPPMLPPSIMPATWMGFMAAEPRTAIPFTVSPALGPGMASPDLMPPTPPCAPSAAPPMPL